MANKKTIPEKEAKIYRDQLKRVLKKTVRDFGKGLEDVVKEVIQIYSTSSYHSQELKQELAYLIRDCIDDRGWDFAKHSQNIEQFLTDKVYNITSSFEEPILDDDKGYSWGQVYINGQGTIISPLEAEIEKPHPDYNNRYGWFIVGWSDY